MDRTSEPLLIVEDDLGLQRLLQKKLSLAGFQATAVTSGSEALDWLATHRPSLMLLDYSLPDMRGEELIEALEARGNSIPFIVSTGNASAPIAVAMMKLGARDYLIKSPDLIEILPAVVERVLHQVKQERQLAAAEAAVRASEKRYETLVQLAPVGIIHADREGRWLYVNDEWCQLTGMTAEEAIADGWARCIHPDDRQRVLNSWQLAVSRGESVRSEHRFTRPDGSTAWVLAQGSPQRDAQGEITGYVRTVTEITDRKQAELALAASEELNRRIIEVMPGGIVQVAINGEIVQANAEAERLLGVSFDHGLRKYVTDFGTITILEDGTPCPIEDYPVSRCLKTGKPQPPKTIGVRRADGTVVWGVFTAVPLTHAETGQTRGAVVTFLDITARKVAEETLRRQHELLQTVLDSIPVMLVIFDGDQIRSVNREWLRVLGWNLEEIDNSTDLLLARLYPDAEYRRSVMQFINDAAETWHEFHMRTRDGRTIDTAWANMILSDGTNVGIGQDITERKRAERERADLLSREQAARAAVEASEERYRLLAEAMPQFVWAMSADGSGEYCNRFWYEYTGLQQDIPNNIEWPKVVHPDDVERISERWRHGLRTGESFEMEVRYRRAADGQYRWFLARFHPVCHENGRIYRWLGIAVDVHDRHTAQDALRESEARLRALVDNLPFDFWACDSSGRFVMQNPTSVANWGLNIGKLVCELTLPKEALEQWEYSCRLGMSGEVVRSETSYEQDGVKKTTYYVQAPIRDGDAIRGVVGVNIDITDRKQAEEKARQLSADLAHVTRLSTMGTMISELAHEINQPLYAIANFAEACSNVLKTTAQEGQQDVVHWIGQISSQAKRAGEIIRGLGQFVRKSPPQRTEVDLNDLVHEVVDLLNINTRMAEVPLKLELADSLPQVLIDRVQIQQVLVNLMINAVEAMQNLPRERRHLTIRTLARGSEFVEVIVQDNGIGIRPEQMQRLFEPYYTTKAGGMGMGLVISHSIVEAHEGDLWATSEENVGTAFHFTLPVGTEELSDEFR